MTSASLTGSPSWSTMWAVTFRESPSVMVDSESVIDADRLRMTGTRLLSVKLVSVRAMLVDVVMEYSLLL